jgi:hypothetical protein
VGTQVLWACREHSGALVKLSDWIACHLVADREASQSRSRSAHDVTRTFNLERGMIHPKHHQISDDVAAQMESPHIKMTAYVCQD